MKSFLFWRGRVRESRRKRITFFFFFKRRASPPLPQLALSRLFSLSLSLSLYIFPLTVEQVPLPVQLILLEDALCIADVFLCSRERNKEEE